MNKTTKIMSALKFTGALEKRKNAFFGLGKSGIYVIKVKFMI